MFALQEEDGNMKVKIGNMGTFDHNDLPIMLTLDPTEKECIANMAEDAERITFFDGNVYDEASIEDWMDKP
jgi:hypothetical protein